MKTDYRLIQVIESFDDLSYSPVDIYELTPVDYQGNGFYFKPYPSADNHFFVFLKSEEMDDFFLSDPERVITMETGTGKHIKKLVKTPEGIRSTFYSHKLFWMRYDYWHSSAKRLYHAGVELNFKFTHFERSNFTFGSNYAEDHFSLDPVDSSLVKLHEVDATLVVKDKILSLMVMNNDGVDINLEAEIKNVQYSNPGQHHLEYFSTQGAFENDTVIFRFDHVPLSSLNWSDRSLLVSVRGKKNEPFIKHQMSFMFGEFRTPYNLQLGELRNILKKSREI